MKAVCTDLAFVKSCCPPNVYRSVWDRLCDQLFGTLPMGMESEDIFPDIEIWKEGVVMTDTTDPFSFTIVTDSERPPRPTDVIFYKGKYYTIGTVNNNE